jgi:hypothetical protein
MEWRYPMRFSRHAINRVRERGIAATDVALALEYGTEVHARGATFFVLRRRDLPLWLRDAAGGRRAEGTTVVVCDGTVVTVYRNRDVRHFYRKVGRGRPRKTFGPALAA